MPSSSNYRAIPTRLVKGSIHPEYDLDWLVQREHQVVHPSGRLYTDWFFVAKGSKAEMLDLLKVLES